MRDGAMVSASLRQGSPGIGRASVSHSALHSTTYSGNGRPGEACAAASTCARRSGWASQGAISAHWAGVTRTRSPRGVRALPQDTCTSGLMPGPWRTPTCRPLTVP